MAYTDQDIKQFITDKGIGNDPYAMYNYAKQYGVAPGRIDQVMGYAPGTSDKWIQQQGLQGLAGGAVGGTAPTQGNYSSDQIRQFITDKGIANNPQAMYAYAQQYGVQPGLVDQALGASSGQSANWIQQNGLSPINAPQSAPAAQPPAQPPAQPNPYTQAAQPQTTRQPGMPSMGQYQQAQPSNPYMPMAGSSGPTQNPYMGQMADEITRRAATQFNQQINPAINRAAVANGGYGGSRQGIAQGLAMSQGMDNIAGQLTNLYGTQFNADRNYGLQSDALDLNVYNANQNWMRQGQQDQLGLADRLLGWNQQYGVGNATNVQNTPLNYWNQFTNAATQLGGMGGSQSQNLQGNPWLGALGGYQLGSSLWKG